MVELVKVNEHIETAFPCPSPRLQRAARCLLDAPDEVAPNAMRAMAAHAAVHPSTRARLAERFEFPGYDAFREPFRERRLRALGAYWPDAR